jgi:hypothetical protein
VPGCPGGLGWLAGTWRRTLLVDADGVEDVSTEVTWLQGARSYLDLRSPAGRPSFDGVRGLLDLDLDQVRWLAGQEAFAGVLIDRGDHVEWTRHIDLHPPGPYPDAGTLRERDGLLVERGWHTDYVEHWRGSPGATDPSWAMVLGEIGAGARARLLRVGGSFGWARGRRRGPVRRQALREFVDAAGSLTEAQDAVDVEVSLGVVEGGAWRVTASTLPFREGVELCLPSPAGPAPGGRPAGGDMVTTTEAAPDGSPVVRSWRVGHVEGDVEGEVFR